MGGTGLIDLRAAAFFTGRSYRSLVRLHQRGLLESRGVDEHGRNLYDITIISRLEQPGRPSELLAS